MKILFVASEGRPYSKTGGLADVVEALPKALSEMGHEVAVFLPRYRGNKITSTIISSLTIPLGDTLRFPALAEAAPVAGVRYYFLDDPEYFDREAPYGTKYGDYGDNAERFAEFSRAAIEFTKRVWLPDVLHCHDWQSALVPVLLRTQYANDPNVRSIPVVFTIHNVAYQGIVPVHGDAANRSARSAVHDRRAGIFRRRELLEGRDRVCGLLDYSEPALCEGDSDAGISARISMG